MGASASARKVVPALLVHKIDYVALRSRLQLFGNSFSLEISPRDYHGSGIHCDGPLTKSWDRIGVGTVVYVNWVAKNIEHGSLVLEACKALTGKGLRPAPHLPACRFDSDEAFAQVLDGLKGTGGCNFAMMLGGNDCFERASAGEVPPRFSSASSLLLGGPDMPDTLEQLSSAGVTAVSVGGYPEGHPGLEFHATESHSLLEGKCRALLAKGFEVHVATQFCFDSAVLVSWLHNTRLALAAVRDEVVATAAAAAAAASSPPTSLVAPVPAVRFHIGIPGPTPRSKLERISKICEVPSLFLASAFDLVDGNGEGFVDHTKLKKACAILGVEPGKVKELLAKHDSNGDGKLQRVEFASMLADLSLQEPASPSPRSPKSPQSPSSPHFGPSALLDRGESAVVKDDVADSSVVQLRKSNDENTKPATTGKGLIWPAEIVTALAHYCEADGVSKDEVCLHIYPFGGIKSSLDMVDALKAGTFPELDPPTE